MDVDFFCYVLIGEKSASDYMILCRIKDYDKKMIQRIIGVAFPEFFQTLPLRFKFLKSFKKIKTRIALHPKGYPSWFDCQVFPNKEGNDWERFPYVALKSFCKEGERYCEANRYTLPSL